MKRVRKATSTDTMDFLKSVDKTTRGRFAIKMMAIAKYIADFKNSSNYKQNEIAENLEIAESQVSKWLSGFHNLTLKSIIKLEAASDIKILNPAIWGEVNTESISVGKIEVIIKSDHFKGSGLTQTKETQDKYGIHVDNYLSIVGGMQATNNYTERYLIPNS